MHTTRTKPEKHWTGVGRRCKAMGWPIETVLTKNETINAWIRAGYEGAK